MITPDPVTIGGSFQAQGSGFGVADTGDEFMVLLSTAPGLVAIPGDGRQIGIGFTPLVLTTAATPLLKGTIAAEGSASTPLVNFPAAFPAGTTLYYVALSHAGPVYHSITDAGSFTLQ